MKLLNAEDAKKLLDSNTQEMNVTANMASKVLKRPTPSTLEEWEQFTTVNDDKAQMRLARAMGYPPSWRVVRYVNVCLMHPLK